MKASTGADRVFDHRPPSDAPALVPWWRDRRPRFRIARAIIVLVAAVIGAIGGFALAVHTVVHPCSGC